jgi:OPT family oligopeptide transporter
MSIENWRDIPWEEKPGIRQITFRAVIVGLLIGSIILVSNFQFGLQTGWVSMMSLPSALLSFAIFKNFQKSLAFEFTDVENVFIQSIAVAVGTGPLAYGFVGVIPAIEKFLKPEESGIGRLISFSLKDLIIWSLGLSFFGIFFAVPLRKQVIIKEKLPFPSGSATATLIAVLNETEVRYEDNEENKILNEYNESLISEEEEETTTNDVQNSTPNENTSLLESQNLKGLANSELYNEKLKSLITTFSVSSTYTLVSYFIPQLRSIPIFGEYLNSHYLWNLQPSPAYIGQGIIMGLLTVSYMLFGTVLGWGILAPLSKNQGWADGPIDDWKTGAQGWILWISLAVMISDSIVSFFVVTAQSIYRLYEGGQKRKSTTDSQKSAADLDSAYLVDTKTVVIGLALSSILCIVTMVYLFGVKIVPIYSLVIAIVLTLFLSVLGVRALGETDLNPVSGIGKLSQLLFALVIPRDHPGSVLVNLVAGGIAEAGAQQAGDLMQDLKTGHLVGASPYAQFIAQIIGTVWSVVLSSVMYKVYNVVYEIPNKVFRIPTAVIWIDCSRLVTGDGLPPHALEFSIIFGGIFGVISLLKNLYKNNAKVQKKLIWLPSGVAVGIGIYNTPSFTIARFIGGVIGYIWLKKVKFSHEGKTSMIVFSSGLVLGEGMFSIVNMTLTSLGVPHL